VRLRTLLPGALVAVPLVVGAVLSFTRLVEPDGGGWVRLESFTPHGMAAYAVGLLVAVGMLLRRRGVAWAATAAVAAVGLWLHCWWFAPMVTGDRPAPAAGAEPLRVMTANLYGDAADGIGTVAVVAEQDVDVLVLQEITAATLADMDRAGLADLLPHRAGRPAEGAEGTMVLAREPLGTAALLDTVWDGWRVQRGDLTILGVHLISPVDHSAWVGDHEVLLDAAVAADADLVVGDLNATVDHAPMRRLEDAGFRSATELANDGFQPTWPAYGFESVLGIPVPHVVAIDHVLVGDRLTAISTHTVDLPGSDHRGLVAEVAPR
jgi:endonuclease/exonuclease/phosphatase family metal-dependent hydrolase